MPTSEPTSVVAEGDIYFRLHIEINDPNDTRRREERYQGVNNWIKVRLVSVLA